MMNLTRAKTFVFRYKWFFIAGLVLLVILAIMPKIIVLKREGLPARCAAGKVWSAGKNKCVCAGSSEWDGSKCVTCGAGMVWDWGKKPRAGCACAPGTTWNGKWCAKPLVNAARKQDCYNMTANTGATLRTKPGGFRKTNVRATYHEYGEAGGPQYYQNTTSCGDFVGDTIANNMAVGKKLLKFPWTAFCINGQQVQSGLCGKCLRITNRDGGVSTVVRVMDNGGCSGRQPDGSDGNGLDIQPCAFNAIDVSGRGNRDGHLWLDVEEVECGPDAEIYDARR